MVKYEFVEGAICEDIPWEIRMPEIGHSYDTKVPICRHATNIVPSRELTSSKFYDQEFPAVIVAFNEGGYAETMICLKCVLREAKKLGIVED